jgi:tetratricopeptide (TPR) repeat protein
MDNRLELARAYDLLHLIHTQQGSPERAAFRGLSLPIWEDLGDLKRQATVLNNMGIEAYFDGEWATALEVYERSRALFARIGDVSSEAMAMNNIGEILSDQGRIVEAEELFRSVREVVDSAGHRFLSMMSRLNLGRAAARASRFVEADELLKEALEGFREIHAASLEQEAHARIAEAAVLGGDHERAFHEAELAERLGEAEPSPAIRALIHRIRGYAFLQLRRLDEAALAFEKSIEEARSASVLYELALSLRAYEALRADSTDGGEAQHLLDELEVTCLPEVPT